MSSFSERIYSPSKIALHFSDVEVQTTNSPHREHSNIEGQDLIDTPFSRDPNVSIRCPPDAILSQNRMDDSGYHYTSRSITPVPPANAHDPRSVNFTNYKLNLLFFLLFSFIIYTRNNIYIRSFSILTISLFFRITIVLDRYALENTHRLHLYRSINHNHPPYIALTIIARIFEVKAT